LQKIEELYEKDDAKLDSAFNNFGVCSSKCGIIFIIFTHKLICKNKASADECSTAAEIYQCGLQKDKNLVNQLIFQNQGATEANQKFTFIAVNIFIFFFF